MTHLTSLTDQRFEENSGFVLSKLIPKVIHIKIGSLIVLLFFLLIINMHVTF